jgi:hypothetical protein
MKKRLGYVCLGLAALALIAATDVTIITKTIVDSSKDTIVQSDGTKIYGRIGNTVAVTVDANKVTAPSFVANATPAVVTPVATATAPAGGISERVSIIATAAPTANYIKLPATPVAGADYKVLNRSANPVVLIPGGASTLTNGATFSCAAGTLCSCYAASASELGCK